MIRLDARSRRAGILGIRCVIFPACGDADDDPGADICRRIAIDDDQRLMALNVKLVRIVRVQPVSAARAPLVSGGT